LLLRTADRSIGAWSLQLLLLGDSALVCVAVFAVCMCCRLMSHQIALLLPHLGGKAYSLRSAIVHAIGSLLHKAFDR
jgi:hypothetical protein